MNTQREGDLWCEFTSGSQEAFKELYDTYSDVLYSFGLRYTSDQELVRDCIHDLFIDLHTYRSGLSTSLLNVKFYLLKSFRRKLNQALRRSSVFKLDGWLTTDNIPTIATFTYSTEHDIIADEKQRELLTALAAEINQLPARQREILYLKFRHELDYEDIASLMHISVPTCRTLVYRAVRQLRQKLEGVSVVFTLLMLI
jgi:RNA polymerase sigma factor (sigma-70 family)